MKLNISVLEYFGLVLAMMLYRTSEGELKSCTDLLLLLTEERQKASWLDTWQTGISRTSLVSIYTSASVLSVRLVWALNTLEKTTAFAFHWGPCVAEGQTNEPWALYFIADERSEYWRYNCTTFWVFFFLTVYSSVFIHKHTKSDWTRPWWFTTWDQSLIHSCYCLFEIM